jgi:hypothetical protein
MTKISTVSSSSVLHMVEVTEVVKKILWRLWKPSIYCHVHSSRPPVSTLGQLNMLHVLQPCFVKTYLVTCKRDIVVCVATRLGAVQLGIRVSIPGKGKRNFFSRASRLALGHTQAPIGH